MILQRVDFTKKRAIIPQEKAPERAADTQARSPEPRTRAYIFSKRLNKKLFPYKDPNTGRITSVVTEDGDILTEKDIEAFRLIDKYFGIERIEKVAPGPEQYILMKQEK